MYKLDEIRMLHFELTNKCQASCPMCGRNIQGGIDNPWLVENEITLEHIKEWFPVDFIKQLHTILMCGSFGDPIIAKDTLAICQYFREINPTVQLNMNTNGSARTVKWWKDLAKTGVRIRFGIDGLEDTHHLYRIGTDWKMIIKNVQAFIDAGGQAIWDMLIFDHNKHQVEDCRKMANDMGFIEFVPKHSSRFKAGFVQVLDKQGKTSHYIYPTDRSKEFAITFMEYKLEENKEIHCKAKEQKTVSINAHGEISACCWMDFAADMPMGFSNVDYKDRGFVNPSLKKNTLEEIFSSDYFDRIEATWADKPLRVCSKQCGKFDKLGAQF